MNKTMLKTIRLIAPGAIVMLCVLPYVIQDIKPLSDKLSDGVFMLLVTLCAVAIGGVYYGFNVRGILWRGFVRKCHRNVWAKMIEPHYSEPAVRSVINQLTDAHLMRIFYHIVDNDPSLSDQAHDVRFNGAILTTIVDSISILVFFAVVYTITFFFTDLSVFKWLALAALVLQVPLWLLKWRVSEKHIHLENEQLGVIAQLHSDTVRAKLQDIG